jgi:hypothetical protein
MQKKKRMKKLNRKKTIAAFATLMILATVFTPLMFTPQVAAADPSDWYHTVEGVLDTDTYALYPYMNDETLSVGFSKFGEMIDPITGTGLNYSERDPFANEGIEDMQYWVNGWMIEARYTHRTHHDRTVLAAAMFADMTNWGGDWQVGKQLPFTTAPTGGRKVTTYAETDDMEILYDGPRRFIALCTNHIYDWLDANEDGIVDHPDETWALLDVMITIIFNKVKKEVIVLKDVKLKIDAKILGSPVDCQFSNRGEWDLGAEEDEWKSYAHLYHQELETCYGPENYTDNAWNWHTAPGIMREHKYLATGADLGDRTILLPEGSLEWYGFPIVEDSVWVYLNGDWQIPGDDYTINYMTGYIDFFFDLDSEDEIEVYYKLPKYYENDGWHWDSWEGIPHYYDLAQIISVDEEYVGFAAFWPTLSDYTVDGWARIFDPLLNVSQPDMIGAEPDIPFVIGEWDFMLSGGETWPVDFRGVTVYGLTDNWDADDENIGQGHENDIDREVWYQLQEVFNPWSLRDAVHKYYSREVEFFDGDDETMDFNLTYAPLWWDWDYYCDFDERVLVDGELQAPLWAIPPHEETNYTYTISNVGGYWWINFTENAPPEGDKNIKVLYSPVDRQGRYEWAVVGRDAASVDSVGAALVTAAFKNKGIEIGMAGLDMWDPAISNQIPHVMRQFGDGDGMGDYHHDYAAGDHRASLRDDWCTTWPVASSDMVGIGGPLANVYAYYMNDFTEAYFDESSFEIETSTCWDKNSYASDDDTGYAVISTYKDINGTVNLVIWGHWGRDTFYACKWFHEGGAVQLQDAPYCLTGIVLEIDYTEHEPEVSVAEVLGTISEAEWIHGEEEKGGIHDCP